MAAPSPVGTHTAQSSASAAAAWTNAYDCTGANLLVVDIAWRPGDPEDRTVTSVTFNGDALTQAGSTLATVGSPPNSRAARYYRVSPDQTSGDLVINFSSGSVQAHALIRRYSGADAVTPLGALVTPNTGTTTGSSISRAATSVTADQIVIDFAAITQLNGTGGNTLTIGAGQSADGSSTGTNNLRCAGSRETGTGSITMSWTTAFADELYGHIVGTVNGSGGSAIAAIVSSHLRRMEC